MFLQNKYTIYYYNIIYNAQARAELPIGYVEKHHIIPKSLGGSNSNTNLVKLTAREHFICHLLLVKMLNGHSKYKMAFALNRMLTYSTKHNRYIPSSKLYDLSRKYRSEAISVTHKGIPESAESNLKRSIAQKGIPKGPMSSETKQKLSMSLKGKSSWNKGGTTPLKGLTYEEIHGTDKSIQLKQLKSKQFKGRQFSTETKEIWSKNRKGRNTGGNNSNATPVTIYGITYSSKKEACQQLGISAYKLKKIG